MKMLKCIALLSLGLSGLHATGQPAVPDPQSAATTQEQLTKGAKISPRQRAELAKAAVANTNNEAGASFLASNKAKPGVISLPSGVQYKILKAGTGKRPTDNSSVRCRYQGTLIDGATFDKVDDKTPAAMRVAGFLPGLKEAVKLMPSGSRWEVVVPPQLGYGARGSHGVAPNAVLIYTIEILGVN